MKNRITSAGANADSSTPDEVTTSSQTIAKPNVSCRLTSKELFEKHSTFKDPLAWHVWKMAFDLGNSYGKEIISNFITIILNSAKDKYEKNKNRPLSEASIEAQSCIQVCNAILNAVTNGS